MKEASKSFRGVGRLTGRVGTRWVLPAWTATVAAVLLGFALWLVRGVLRGIPGPVVNGVYVDGAVDVLIVVTYATTGLVMTTIAAVLLARVPGNALGWILGGVAVWQAATFLLGMSLYFLHDPRASETTFANWLGSWTSVIPASASLVLILFPTGRLLSPRWRPLSWLAVIGTGAWVVIEVTGDHLGGTAGVPNPFANPGINTVANIVSLVLVPALIGTVASLVIRYRQSSPAGRLQIKWVAFGGFLVIAVWVVIWGWWMVRPETFGSTATAIATLATLITPTMLAFAILRHRLYAIDRLVSRTVSYTVLATILGGSYVAGVIGVQTVFPSSGSLAVAGTTLALAAAFNPLRRRLHDLMDRRFNRRHFDAAMVMAGFASRVGTVSNTEVLTEALTEVLEQTLAPSSIAIWIRE